MRGWYRTIVIDCGSNVVSAFDRHRGWDWLRCGCHLVHNVVMGSLQVIKNMSHIGEHTPAGRIQRALDRAHAFVTHIRNSRKAATAFRNLQRDGIIADRRSQDRGSPVEEEEVDWHEEDDPGADRAGKKGETPPPPTRVLELKLPVPTRWSSVWYMTERYAAVTVV